MFSPDTERQAAAFDAIGERYDLAFAHKSAQVEAGKWLMEHLPPKARVLDAGCGTGVPTARMLAEAGCDVLGIDISQEMLRLARQNVPTARFARMNAAAPELPAGSFDAVTAFFLLLMLRKAELPGAVRNLARLLRPGGYLLLSMVEGDMDYVPVPFLGQTPHVTLVPQPEMEAVLRGEGLELLDVSTVDFPPTREGTPPERQLFFRCRVSP
jgi:ubiquinone/menaquinone biosynthesis C-methylase UbiE